MKPTHLALITFLILCLLPTSLSADEDNNPLRTWESTAGTKIEARLVDWDPKNQKSVTLEKEDGTRIEVKLAQLSEADQLHLKELAVEAARPNKILFIGNSYTGGIKKMVSDIVAASPNAKCELTFINPGGKTLHFHHENAATMNKIRDGQWDIVVLQDQSQTPAVFADKFLQAAINIDKIIDEAGARTVFYETWGRRDGDKMNAQRFPDYASMQKALSDSYAKAAKECDAELAPVGQAWANLREADPALGIKLYTGDGSHPAKPGAYLAACVLYATLFGEDPTALDFNGGLPADQVTKIHAAVSKAFRK